MGIMRHEHISDQVKRTDQPTGQYKINPNPNTNTKYVLIYYAINAGPFFSLDPIFPVTSATESELKETIFQ